MHLNSESQLTGRGFSICGKNHVWFSTSVLTNRNKIVMTALAAIEVQYKISITHDLGRV